MNKSYEGPLRWIEEQDQRMRGLLVKWAEINSGTSNAAGVRAYSDEVAKELAALDVEVKRIPVQPMVTVGPDASRAETPLADVLSARKRPDAPLKILFNIHMDTVFGPQHAFQKTRMLDDDRINGPGVVDAKGGMVILLTALAALERSEFASKIGWEVLLNPDEEVGSPGSTPFFKEAAARNHFGMIFEPAHPDGALVSERKGSGTYTLIIRGRSAHAGRDFHAGRNAIVAACDYVMRMNELNKRFAPCTFNIGKIDGGGPTNVVPDLAIARFNIRVVKKEDIAPIDAELKRLADEIMPKHEVKHEWFGGVGVPPKQLSEQTLGLLNRIKECGQELGIVLDWRSTGGFSDGNRLANFGLNCVDSLGARGGNLHSFDEYCHLSSLVERAKLATLLLMKFGSEEIEWKS